MVTPVMRSRRRFGRVVDDLTSAREADCKNERPPCHRHELPPPERTTALSGKEFDTELLRLKSRHEKPMPAVTAASVGQDAPVDRSAKRRADAAAGDATADAAKNGGRSNAKPVET